MKTCFRLICVLLVTSAAQAQQLEPFGLQGQRVTALGLAQYADPPNAYIYAATEDQGVHRRGLAAEDSLWRNLGLQNQKITALDIQVWGAGPADFHAPIAGVFPDYNAGDSTLIYRYENEKWVPADSGISRANVNVIQALISFASTGHAEPGAAYAGGNGLVYRSKTFNRRWQEVFHGGIGITNALAVNHTQLFRGAVWAGGETAIFAPWIAKSVDDGVTWKVSFPDLQGDNACNSIAIHPDDPDVVYAGMEGAVIKTVDGGETWNYTGLRDTPVYFYGLTLDSANPDHIYAGGLIANPNTWALWETYDAGKTWQEIPAPLTVPVIQVSGIMDIVADRHSPAVIYIATLGHGVWKYQSNPTGVDDRENHAVPARFVLEQNVPNPFNPETTIRYRLPSTQHVKLEVFNVLGQRTVTLVDERKPAGEHHLRWDGKDAFGQPVASGIYFYRIYFGGKSIATRRMMLLQ